MNNTQNMSKVITRMAIAAQMLSNNILKIK